MITYPKMTLPDDPHEALERVAAYLRTARTDREVIEDGEIVGYWQTPEWLVGLEEIGEECDRVAKRRCSDCDLSDECPNAPKGPCCSWRPMRAQGGVIALLIWIGAFVAVSVAFWLYWRK